MNNLHKTIFRLGGPLISTNEIIFDSALKKKMQEKVNKIGMKNVAAYARKVKVTKICYRSNGHSVVGFVVEPRRIPNKLPCIIWNRGGSGDFGMLKMYH